MTKPPAPPTRPGAAPSRSPAASGMAMGPGSGLIADLLQAQRQVSSLSQEVTELRAGLARRTHQLEVLQQVAGFLAATPKGVQVAGVALEALVREFAAGTCVVWILDDSGAFFQPGAGHGLPWAAWSRLRLPAPNPFPQTPVVLFQEQGLDPEVHAGLLDPLITPGGPQLYFVPFEHQLLLLGFAVLGLETGWIPEEDQDTLTVLQRLVAVSLYNAWLFRDLAHQRDALRSQTGELAGANEALREADRFRSEFLALTSHELRTPLTGILGFTRLVLDGLYADEEEMRQILEDSYASGKHLLELLNDILDLAKIESGRMQMDLRPHRLGTLLDELKGIASAYPRRPGVELAWPAELGGVPEVLVDAGRLKQVLLNLLSNALKFTWQGSVRVVVARGFGGVLLSVVDTGIGVSPEAQRFLFQKFVQADGGHAREYGGTGLGLVICKHLMEMMNGTIRLSSEGEGKGSTLTLSIPFA